MAEEEEKPEPFYVPTPKDRLRPGEEPIGLLGRWDEPDRMERLASELAEPRRVRVLPKHSIRRERPARMPLTPEMKQAHKICEIVMSTPKPTPTDYELCRRAKRLSTDDPKEFKRIFKDFGKKR